MDCIPSYDFIPSPNPAKITDEGNLWRTHKSTRTLRVRVKTRVRKMDTMEQTGQIQGATEKAENKVCCVWIVQCKKVPGLGAELAVKYWLHSCIQVMHSDVSCVSPKERMPLLIHTKPPSARQSPLPRRSVFSGSHLHYPTWYRLWPQKPWELSALNLWIWS